MEVNETGQYPFPIGVYDQSIVAEFYVISVTNSGDISIFHED